MATRIPTLKIDTKSVQALQTVAERPFYAGVGVTDLAVEAVRDYVADVQTRVAGLGKDVQKNVASFDLRPRPARHCGVRRDPARRRASRARPAPSRPASRTSSTTTSRWSRAPTATWSSAARASSAGSAARSRPRTP